MPGTELERKKPSLLARFAALAGSGISAMRGVAALVSGEEQQEHAHTSVRFEPSDISSRAVVITGAAILGAMWFFAFLLFFYFRYEQGHVPETKVARPPSYAPENTLPPEPRLQISERSDYQRELAYETAELNKYRWIDKERGTVSIPIERAMEIIARRGIAPQKTPPDLKLYPPQAGTRDTGFEGKVQKVSP